MREHIFERLARERNITVECGRLYPHGLKRDGMIQTRREESSGEKYLVRAKFRRRTNGCGMQLRSCRKRDERTWCGGIRTTYRCF